MSINSISQASSVQSVMNVTAKNHENVEQKNVSEAKTYEDELIEKTVPPAVKDGSGASDKKSGINLEEAVNRVNNKININQLVQRELEFSIDEESDTTVVKVLDKETKEVIRQIPAEQLLELARALNKGENPRGFLVKETA